MFDCFSSSNFLLPPCFRGVCFSVMLYNTVFGSLWIALDNFGPTLDLFSLTQVFLPPCIWGVCMSVMLHNRFSGTVLCYWDILPPVARLGPIHAVMHFSGSLRCSDFNPTPSSLYKTHCSISIFN